MRRALGAGILFLLLAAALPGQITITVPGGGGGGGGGGSGVDRMSFQMHEAIFPDTDGGSFQPDPGEWRYWEVLLSIGDEVQWSRMIDYTIGTSPQCGLSWNFASGGPTANNVAFDCRISCVSDGDNAISENIADAANPSGDIVVPGTAGNDSHDTWSAANFDSCTKGDWLVIQFERLTPSGTSAGTADVHVRGAWIEWTN